MKAPEQPSSGPPEPPARPPEDRSRSPLILVADGDEAVADLTERVLQRFGFRVIAARDGEEAVDRLTADEPDLVLLEANLSRRGGFEVCADIRRQSQTPVIMLTTSQDKEDVLRAFEAGADDYVTKPFSPFQLVACITAVLERRASPETLKTTDSE